ncbi:hypothetical protein F5Y14DRAFT_82236 [Nemania sp. NC0429]|nr:hypothetical protein F5Y14DRAFT_82236 [Nemania sp. NC0429]
MRYTPLILLTGPIAFSVGTNHHLNLHSNHRSRSLDMMASGYDKHPKGNFATANAISPVPRTSAGVFITKDECSSGMVDCSDAQCDQCGSCCVKGTQCTRNSCVSEPALLVESVTVTTTLTPVVSTTPTVIPGLKSDHNSGEHVTLIPEKSVTSYIYDHVSVQTTYSSVVLETSMVTSEVNSPSTQISTITSTLFIDAKSTATVASTVIVTSTQMATPTQARSPSTKSADSTESITTKTPKNLAIKTSSLVSTTNSNHTKVATEATPVRDGDVSGLQAATGVSTTRQKSDSPSSSPITSSPTGSGSSSSDLSPWDGLSTGAKAGIGTGAAAASLALLGIMVFFILGKRRRPTPAVSGDNAVNNWTPPPSPIRHSHLDAREVSYTERAAALAHSMEHMGEPTSAFGVRESQKSAVFGSPGRGASPSEASVLVDGKPEDAVWYMGLNTEHHEVFGQQYHEMPSFPRPSHSRYYGRSNIW